MRYMRYSPKQKRRERLDNARGRTLNDKRMRRVATSGRFFEKPKAIPYLWTNNIYPFALLIALIFLLINV